MSIIQKNWHTTAVFNLIHFLPLGEGICKLLLNTEEAIVAMPAASLVRLWAQQRCGDRAALSVVQHQLGPISSVLEGD